MLDPLGTALDPEKVIRRPLRQQKAPGKGAQDQEQLTMVRELGGLAMRPEILKWITHNDFAETHSTYSNHPGKYL